MQIHSTFPTWFAKAVLAAALVLIVSGCAGTPPYPGDVPADPAALTPVEHAKVSMGLPAGWERSETAVNGKTILVAFKNPKTNANGSMQCYSTLIGKSGMADVMRSGVRGSSGNAELVKGPFTVGGGIHKPHMEIYRGTVTDKGQEIPATFYIAYNMFRTFICNYALLVVEKGEPNAATETDFVAMINSVKRSAIK